MPLRAAAGEAIPGSPAAPHTSGAPDTPAAPVVPTAPATHAAPVVPDAPGAGASSLEGTVKAVTLRWMSGEEEVFNGAWDTVLQVKMHLVNNRTDEPLFLSDIAILSTDYELLSDDAPVLPVMALVLQELKTRENLQDWKKDIQLHYIAEGVEGIKRIGRQVEKDGVIDVARVIESQRGGRVFVALQDGDPNRLCELVGYESHINSLGIYTLVAAKGDPNADIGGSVLMHAIHESNCPVVDFLIEQKTDVNKPGNHWCAESVLPLHTATYLAAFGSGDVNIIRSLLNAKASVHNKGRNGKTVIQHFLEYSRWFLRCKKPQPNRRPTQVAQVLQQALDIDNDTTRLLSASGSSSSSHPVPNPSIVDDMHALSAGAVHDADPWTDEPHFYNLDYPPVSFDEAHHILYPTPNLDDAHHRVHRCHPDELLAENARRRLDELAGENTWCRADDVPSENDARRTPSARSSMHIAERFADGQRYTPSARSSTRFSVDERATPCASRSASRRTSHRTASRRPSGHLILADMDARIYGDNDIFARLHHLDRRISERRDSYLESELQSYNSVDNVPNSGSGNANPLINHELLARLQELNRRISERDSEIRRFNSDVGTTARSSVAGPTTNNGATSSGNGPGLLDYERQKTLMRQLLQRTVVEDGIGFPLESERRCTLERARNEVAMLLQQALETSANVLEEALEKTKCDME
eukprot:GEMP01007413.1.p1 GENE.GEMP01007413.1~~GEMP01007413.1.p1  ORF type:complete len:701 (+),score=183.43 GEMP01007413.1:60-2162(+)